jgi:hypothetical protein|nr:MAG TPA: hypothetical protein [Caudoviricetes sp.]
MENIVNVEGTELDVREYNGQMVVTFDDIDLVHKRPHGTARNAFKRNKRHFIDGVDYFVLEKENSNVHETYIRNIDIPNRGITVFTESGYLMLVKPFKDDLSWDVQRRLVNAYFALKNQQPTAAIEEKPTLEFETDWFCINRGKINYVCRCYDITSKEYMHHLLEVLGRTYNFDEAKRIYSATTGNWKCRNSEVITYFPQLSDLASKILQKDLADCATEETP